MADAVPWVADYALRAGLRYEPDPDERWLRVWEPYVTLRTPIRYEHALSTTGTTSALTIARFVLSPREGYAVGDEGWIAIGQDERLRGRAAATNDASPIFRDDAASLPRRQTGDPAFDAVFASFAESDETLAQTLHASVRKLTLGWRAPLHFEIRPGGFVLAPVALRPDPQSLAWLLDAARVFANKAAQQK
jgi:hypothetical protein